MMIPTIHLNGTGKDELLKELKEAHDAVTLALDKVAAITVHGRDYYPQGPDAYSKARAEMDARLLKLRSVKADLIKMHDVLQREAWLLKSEGL